jgi:membrane protein DedA with SNARE-associated domain
MNGRFPLDVFLIILFPFFTIAASVFFVPLFIAAHVHHRLAVTVALVLAAVFLLSVLFVWVRRRRRRNA